jgi:predicted SnoaL-like aldol condensation-catalyzing enzyme
MSVEQNKAVVRRFMTEILAGGNLDLVDELLAPNYVNRMSGTDRAATKVLFATLRSALPGLRMQIENLVAEGDAVVARFTMETTNAENKTLARGLTYYRLANGKIVEDEPITTPDLRQLLGIPMPAPADR